MTFDQTHLSLRLECDYCVQQGFFVKKIKRKIINEKLIINGIIKMSNLGNLYITWTNINKHENMTLHRQSPSDLKYFFPDFPY